MTVIAALFLLGVLIFAHELGHLLAAWALGAAVREFSIGFGPTLWTGHLPHRRPARRVPVTVRLLPWGGFVRFGAPTAVEGQGSSERRPLHDPFGAVSPLRRLVIALAGPVASILLTAGLFAGALLTWESPPPPAIDGLDAVEAAQFSPILAGAIQATSSPRILAAGPDSTTSTPLLTDPGIAWRPLGPVEAMRASARATREATVLVAAMTWWLVRNPPVLYEYIGGPVGMVAGGAQLAASSSTPTDHGVAAPAHHDVPPRGPPQSVPRQRSGGDHPARPASRFASTRGYAMLIAYMAFLSLGMAFLNLVPIPPFDGFHAAISVVEAVSRRRVPMRVRLICAIGGVVLFLALALRGAINDLGRIRLGAGIGAGSVSPVLQR